LITLAFAAKVAASPRRVWRALTDPALVARWRPEFAGWRTPAPASLGEPGCVARFRCRLRGFPVVGELRVLGAREGASLRTRVRLGLFNFEESLSLQREPGVAGTTRIGLVLSLANQAPLVSGSLDRFGVRRLASELAERTLSALCAVCEDAASDAAPVALPSD
jgi:hypothetical protein